MRLGRTARPKVRDVVLFSVLASLTGHLRFRFSAPRRLGRAGLLPPDERYAESECLKLFVILESALLLWSLLLASQGARITRTLGGEWLTAQGQTPYARRDLSPATDFSDPSEPTHRFIRTGKGKCGIRTDVTFPVVD